MPNEETQTQPTPAKTTELRVVDRWPTQSESIEKLADALAKAQSEMGNAVKAVDNEFFKSKYADLAAVIDVSRPHLTKNGLSVTQGTIPVGTELLMVTTLMHTSGQWLKSYYPVVAKDRSNPQQLGSASTYARRYQYSGMVGVAQEDDDGNAASGQKEAKAQGASEESKATLRKAFKDGLIPVEEAEFEKTLSTMGEAQARAAIAKYAPKPKNDARDKVAAIQGGDNV